MSELRKRLDAMERRGNKPRCHRLTSTGNVMDSLSEQGLLFRQSSITEH